ncbi:UNVERIFIED_CONTAM: hypothetical protein PYX00_008267 [Menopon gallinae]|uniref:EamA domain-containing protein n=1 Tax=Menopon gallinae TaxID=328185 RepID=A0AAW2HMK2_9NEOP
MLNSSAFLSGLCAAFASIFGKLSGLDYYNIDSRLVICLRIFCFLTMIALNGLMWNFFVKALQSSKSSLEATILNTATNYVSSGLLAYVIFGEVTGILWWSGITLILLGVMVITNSSPSQETKSEKARQ